MRVAAGFGLAVVARGAGTKQDWGAPPERLGLLVDLSRMAGILEHSSGDLVARAWAGTRLVDFAGALANGAQRLAVDELVPGSSLGGIVATGISGPLRFGYGAVRDVLLGATVVRADGVVARAGSKVVKNVAGYDLSKLFTGSYGTLGILTELTFKLRPLPERRLFITAAFGAPAEVASALAALVRSPAAPAAIELFRSAPDAPVMISVLVEGRVRPAELRAGQVASTLSLAAGVSPVAPTWWAELPGPVTLKLTSALSAVPALVEHAGRACASLGLRAQLAGSAGAGVLYLGLPESVPTSQVMALLSELRIFSLRAQGHVTMLRGPAALKAGVDIWGPVRGLDLMRRIKERFDPGRLLSPGRFVGGI